ncbi:MFS transporter [Luedemannella flava]
MAPARHRRPHLRGRVRLPVHHGALPAERPRVLRDVGRPGVPAHAHRDRGRVAVGRPGLVARFGARPVLVAGLGLFAAGIGLLSRAPVDGSYTVDLLPVFLVAGLGFGVAMPAVTMLAMANATPDNAGFASGVVNTVQQAGAVAGLATLTAIAAARTRGYSRTVLT